MCLGFALEGALAERYEGKQYGLQEKKGGGVVAGGWGGLFFVKYATSRASPPSLGDAGVAAERGKAISHSGSESRRARTLPALALSEPVDRNCGLLVSTCRCMCVLPLLLALYVMARTGGGGIWRAMRCKMHDGRVCWRSSSRFHRGFKQHKT